MCLPVALLFGCSDQSVDVAESTFDSSAAYDLEPIIDVQRLSHFSEEDFRTRWEETVCVNWFEDGEEATCHFKPIANKWVDDPCGFAIEATVHRYDVGFRDGDVVRIAIDLRDRKFWFSLKSLVNLGVKPITGAPPTVEHNHRWSSVIIHEHDGIHRLEMHSDDTSRYIESVEAWFIPFEIYMPHNELYVIRGVDEDCPGRAEELIESDSAGMCRE